MLNRHMFPINESVKDAINFEANGKVPVRLGSLKHCRLAAGRS